MAGLIVHEWISEHGGSENVAEELARVFPDSDILALWNDAPERFAGRRVRESWLAKTPLRRSKAAALPFMPRVWARTDVSGYDFVLASSHLFAHHVGGRTGERGVPKFVYVHTPARYIWNPELDARGANVMARLASPSLRRVDRARAADGALFAANSAYVQERIRTSWDQDAVVIHPPVDVTRLQSVEDWRERLSGEELRLVDSLPQTFVLGASRFVPYKRLDLVIRAGESAGLPVVLAGAGPLADELAAQAADASVPVVFVPRPSDAMLAALYQRAAVFVFPAVEDFGIMPVEAMSLGTPVLVGADGGARESVEAVDGGAVVDSFESADTGDAVRRLVDAGSPDTSRVRDLFGSDTFRSRILAWTGVSA